ncbi:hypothetical protein HMPREF9061_01212 [Actinomyces sp. oral taxon 181 str. F0379]|nr:hypothetical protein HMPREF9061_01212 [Actinomyces sp. oral taxon 181 str. F0379]
MGSVSALMKLLLADKLQLSFLILDLAALNSTRRRQLSGCNQGQFQGDHSHG